MLKDPSNDADCAVCLVVYCGRESVGIPAVRGLPDDADEDDRAPFEGAAGSSRRL